MKTESTIRPSQFRTEYDGDYVELIFTENVTESVKEDSRIFTYDEYRLKVKSRSGIEDVVRKSINDWISAAKQKEYNDLANDIRAKRNELLEKSDKEMCFDRIVKANSNTENFIEALNDVLTGDWAVYRQKLRDITKQKGFPYNVSFPDTPK